MNVFGSVDSWEDARGVVIVEKQSECLVFGRGLGTVSGGRCGRIDFVIVISDISGDVRRKELVVGLLILDSVRGWGGNSQWVWGVSFANIVGGANGVGHGRISI